MEENGSNGLCLECGLCCNGVIFARGQLQSQDDEARLRALGLRLLAGSARRERAECGAADPGPKFLQPCAVLEGRRCRIYSDRPVYCRQFECLLLKGVKAGRLDGTAALRVIRQALRRVEKVKTLLRELGDTDEEVALSLRFRRVKKRLEADLPGEKAADSFGRLTLAVHDLNMLLSDAFYPGPG